MIWFHRSPEQKCLKFRNIKQTGRQTNEGRYAKYTFSPLFQTKSLSKIIRIFLFFFLYFSTFICCTHELFIYRDYWAAVNRNSMCRSIDFAKWKIFDFAHLKEKNTAEHRNEVEESRAKQMFFNLFDNFSKSWNKMMKNYYLWNVHIRVQSQTRWLRYLCGENIFHFSIYFAVGDVVSALVSFFALFREFVERIFLFEFKIPSVCSYILQGFSELRTPDDFYPK